MPRKRSGSFAWRNSSQASPSSTAESWRELRAGLRERAQDEQEEDEDREDGEAEDAAAVALLEREGGEQLVGQLGAGDDRQAEPGQRAGSARRRCAASGGGSARRRRSPTAAISPALRSAVSSGGKMPACGDHGRLEDRAPPARASAAAASGKTSVISTSLRRRSASEAAPTAVTSDDRRRHRDQLPPPAPPGEHARGRPGRAATIST